MNATKLQKNNEGRKRAGVEAVHTNVGGSRGSFCLLLRSTAGIRTSAHFRAVPRQQFESMEVSQLSGLFPIGAGFIC